MLKVIIADDESLSRDAIRLRLEQFNHIEVTAEADNGEDAYLLCQTLKPDVMFLDINMPKLTGIEAAKKVGDVSNALLVFITAYDQFALEAFRQNAVDYLTKPIDDVEFNAMVDKISQRKKEILALESLENLTDTANPQNHWLKRISIKENGEIRLFDTNQIESITSVKDYLCIRIDGQVYVQRQTMQQIEQQLDPSTFIRCHRSHIINKNLFHGWVKDNNLDCLLINDQKHPVSRRYKTKVKQLLTFKLKVWIGIGRYLIYLRKVGKTAFHIKFLLMRQHCVIDMYKAEG